METATSKENLQVEEIRQAILAHCWGDSNGNVNGSHDAAKAIASLYASPRPEAVGEAVKAERERCARIAVERAASWGQWTSAEAAGADIAAAIRRGT